MATTITQTEEAADFPDVLYTVLLSVAAAALDKAMIWQRIEAYIAYRWTPRVVTWVVEGPGDWRPTMTPTTISTVEAWVNEAWVETDLVTASPYGGFYLPDCGPYRFGATVGGGSPEAEVPAVVLEAFRRLAEFMSAKPGEAGARSYSVTIDGLSESYIKDQAWVAMALQTSGAADLLRPFRRAP